MEVTPLTMTKMIQPIGNWSIPDDEDSSDDESMPSLQNETSSSSDDESIPIEYDEELDEDGDVLAPPAPQDNRPPIETPQVEQVTQTAYNFDAAIERALCQHLQAHYPPRQTNQNVDNHLTQIKSKVGNAQADLTTINRNTADVVDLIHQLLVNNATLKEQNADIKTQLDRQELRHMTEAVDKVVNKASFSPDLPQKHSGYLQENEDDTELDALLPQVTTATPHNNYASLTDDEIDSLRPNPQLWQAGQQAMFLHGTNIYLWVHIIKLDQFEPGVMSEPKYVGHFLHDKVQRIFPHSKLLKIHNATIPNLTKKPIPVQVREKTIRLGDNVYVTPPNVLQVGDEVFWQHAAGLITQVTVINVCNHRS